MVREAIDLTEFIRPGDQILWGHAGGEATALIDILLRQQDALPPFTVYSGYLAYEGVTPETLRRGHMRGPGGMGRLADFARAGRLAPVPARLYDMPVLLRRRLLRADVVFLHVGPPDEEGYCSTGVMADYMLAAADAARTVLGEINSCMPNTFGDTRIHQSRFAAAVYTDRPLPTWPERSYGETERRIGEHVAELVQDGDTIQLGIGGISSAVAAALRGRRDLGVHSGLITDGIVELIEHEVVTNRRKSIDRGTTVGNWLMGTERLYRWADRNPALAMRSAEYVHSSCTIARIEKFRAINTVLEVDLTGQANAELADTVFIGGVGGLADFVRGALMAPGGSSVIALPSTARRGTISRIVARIPSGVVTVPRYDADYVVTEWGIAHLRGKSLRQRAEELISVAHPDFRGELRSAASRLL